jgi:apolipoprotein N-acyltransferase
MGKVQEEAAKAPQYAVSVIQGNVGLDILWDPARRLDIVRRHVQLTGRAAAGVKERPWLAVWPESAGPFYFLNDARATQPVLQAAQEYKAYLMLGTLGSVLKSGRPRPTNRAWLVGPDGQPAGYYDKVHLVPFGEYVPLEKILFFVRALAVVSDNFEPGTQGHTLKAGPANLGPLICYESIFPELARSQCAKGADLIVNQTNDAWFGLTGASAQHMSHLVLRCVENRRACARAGNTGISGFIEPDGRVFQTTGLYVLAEQTRALPLLKSSTFFTRHGDVAGWLGFLGGLALLLRAWWGQKNRKEG